MDSAELTYWMAFDRIDPFGQERADLRAGIIASTYSNWHRTPNQDRFTPADFMFKYKEQPKEQTPQEVEGQIDCAMTALTMAAEFAGGIDGDSIENHH